MEFLQLQLLGGFSAACSSQALQNFRTDKVRGLLAYLAVEMDYPLRRDFLAALLWPEYSQESALRSLRKAIHYLRQALEAAKPGLSQHLLTITSRDIELHSPYLHLDAERMSSLLQLSQAHQHRDLASCSTCTAGLEEASDLYRGDFLQGFSIKDSIHFAEWQTFQREKFGRQALQICALLAEVYLEQSEYERAFEAAARQAAIEPLREQSYMQMMRALFFQGRRNEAASIFEDYRCLLAQELDLDPGHEIRRFFEQIRSGGRIIHG
jgi:DNA-binding SARP family transcriptional activator